MRRSVDLPHPLVPKMATSSPGATVIVMSLSTSRGCVLAVLLMAVAAAREVRELRGAANVRPTPSNRTSNAVFFIETDVTHACYRASKLKVTCRNAMTHCVTRAPHLSFRIESGEVVTLAATSFIESGEVVTFSADRSPLLPFRCRNCGRGRHLTRLDAPPVQSRWGRARRAWPPECRESSRPCREQARLLRRPSLPTAPRTRGCAGRPAEW